MFSLQNAIDNFFDILQALDKKYQLSKTVGPDYYEPGMMENLEQYQGDYDSNKKIAIIKTEVKGLRYENRTSRLDSLLIGETIQILREPGNVYNSNNFTVLNNRGESLGNLPAELCNALAPLYDAGYAVIDSSSVSYIERIGERSRYAKQGVLFTKIVLRLRGI